MIPKFITMLTHPEQKVRELAFQCINPFILPMPHALLINLDTFLSVHTCTYTQHTYV